jgi:hypothetical protein
MGQRIPYFTERFLQKYNNANKWQMRKIKMGHKKNYLQPIDYMEPLSGIEPLTY